MKPLGGGTDKKSFLRSLARVAKNSGADALHECGCAGDSAKPVCRSGCGRELHDGDYNFCGIPCHKRRIHVSHTTLYPGLCAPNRDDLGGLNWHASTEFV